MGAGVEAGLERQAAEAGPGEQAEWQAAEARSRERAERQAAEVGINEKMHKTGFGADGIREAFSIEQQDMKTYSPLTLAYLGDAVYDLIVRTMLVEQKNIPVNKLHHHASAIVRAEAQKDAYHRIKDELTEEEIAVFKRGRNAKSYTSAKNATIGDYRVATGLEALFGYWYLMGQTERMLSMAKLGFSWTKEDPA